jgi:hypothetical protein
MGEGAAHARAETWRAWAMNLDLETVVACVKAVSATATQVVEKSHGMDGAAIVAVSAAVTALTQLFKWASAIPDKYGALAVMVLSMFGVGFWAWSEGNFERAQSFNYFAGWVAVATSAAGIFGFTRAASGAVSSMTPPPTGGAGTNPTFKE